MYFNKKILQWLDLIKSQRISVLSVMAASILTTRSSDLLRREMMAW